MLTQTINDYTLAVGFDPDPQSPREWSSVGRIALLAGSRYAFGEEKLSREELAAIANDPHIIVLPIYLYDHSGITIRTTPFSCPWDSGQVGIIYCHKAVAIKEWGKKIATKRVREKAMQYMTGEIQTLDQYLTGEVYFWEITNAQGVSVDSCYGFYGTPQECMAEAQAALHCLVR